MFSDFPTWWDGLSTISKIYWIIAFPATLLFLIQLVMTFVGGDADHDTDVNHDAGGHADGGGFQIFTVKNTIAFFTIFAWSGLACISGNLNLAAILIISVFCGLIMMIIMAALFYYISKLTYSGTMDFNNAISQTGTVYISIPAKKSGVGKVQVKVQGALRTLDAMTEDPEIIKTNSVIQVTEIINENILVVKRVR
jgi:hypothetical protein